MSLVSLLATTILITLANSTPMIYAANQRAKIPVDHDHLLLVLLLNRKDFGSKLKPYDETGGIYKTSIESDSGGGDVATSGGNLSRDKRIGSLSIVNSVDVLRQRVLLELARRKAMEDQRQISENRRILDSVGKRSYDADDDGAELYSYPHRSPRIKRLPYYDVLEEEGQRVDRLPLQ